MGILVRKDVGFGEVISKTYVKLTPYFTPKNGGEWRVEAQVFLSKRAKEINIIKKWLVHRANVIQVPVEYDEDVATRLSVPEATWSSFADQGPWETAEEVEYVVKNYLNIPSEPIQTTSVYLYNRENAVGVSDVIQLDDIYTMVYATIKNPNAQLFALIESPQMSKQDTVNSIEDDVESDVDVITRLSNDYSILGKLGPGEEKLSIPSIWENGWR